MRRVLPSAVIEIHTENHLSSPLVRRHRFEHLLAPIQNANAGRRINFMSAKTVKITIQILNIHLHMRNGLCSIDENRNIFSERAGQLIADLPGGHEFAVGEFAG